MPHLAACESRAVLHTAVLMLAQIIVVSGCFLSPPFWPLLFKFAVIYKN